MSNIKLHEATKEFKLSNKLAMYFLEKMKVAVKSHSSVLSLDQLELLREFSQNPSKYDAIVKSFSTLTGEEKSKPVAKGGTAKKPDIPPKKKEEKKAAAKEEKKPEKGEEKREVKKKEKPEKEEAKVKAKIEKPEKKRVEEKKAEVRKAEEKKVEVKKAVEKRVKEEKPPLPQPQKPKIVPAKQPEKVIVQAKPVFAQARAVVPPPKKEEPAPQKPLVAEVKAKAEPELKLPEKIQVADFLTAKELADKLNIRMKVLEERLVALKMNYQSNQYMEKKDILELCSSLNVAVDMLEYEDYLFAMAVAKPGVRRSTRAPVVTVMGHVDHGKTTLLDTLRKTRVAEKEVGGITQKIGAYKVRAKEGEIIFIDTPGHEAFTNMRARGAKVTDIVVLVVAANDGVQPQTLEAIQHARSGKVPIIVAINKIDLPGASADKVKQQLAKQNLMVEEYGGDVVAVEISAKFNQNLDALLEMIQLVAQMLELKKYENIPARGTIIEARLDPQLGPIGTVLLQNGSLRRGDNFICGSTYGKIKSIFDDQGRMLAEASVPDPVEIMGFNDVPEAGDVFQVGDDVAQIANIVEIRRLTLKDARTRDIMLEKRVTMENIFQLMDQSQVQVFSMLIKADNFGSSEVLERLLQKYSQEKLKIEIVYRGIGNITESDILLATAAKALVIGFNVRAPQKILELAQRNGVEIKLYNIIYHLVQDMDQAVAGKIIPETRAVLVGKAEVLQKFKIGKLGYVAGCIVREGKVTNKVKIKVLRGNDLLFEGDIETLKRLKDEASEVHAGTECGIRIRNFSNVEPGDILEFYLSEVIAP